MATGIEAAIEGRVDALPSGLREHIHRVLQEALTLAHRHDMDQDKVKFGALAHDVARAMKGDDLLSRAREMGIPIHPVEERLPVLLHGPVGAELLKREGLDDGEVYDAVYWHTTCRAGLGPVAKAVYLADKLDPQKIARYPFQAELHELAAHSLDAAILKFLERDLCSLLQEGSLLHPASVNARNELLLKAR